MYLGFATETGAPGPSTLATIFVGFPSITYIALKGVPMWAGALLSGLAIPMTVLGIVVAVAAAIYMAIQWGNRGDKVLGSDDWLFCHGQIIKSLKVVMIALAVAAFGFAVPRGDYQTRVEYKEKIVQVAPKFQQVYDKCLAPIPETPENRASCLNTANMIVRNSTKDEIVRKVYLVPKLPDMVHDCMVEYNFVNAEGNEAVMARRQVCTESATKMYVAMVDQYKQKN
jgi:hypothetical protein